MAHRSKKPLRKKHFVVYGRIESSGARHIEEWTGDARSMATAMRKAISDIWDRPTVRWKHLQSVTLTAYMEGGAQRRAA